MGIWHCLFIYIAVLSRNKKQFTPKGRVVISFLETVEKIVKNGKVTVGNEHSPPQILDSLRGDALVADYAL